MSGWTNQAATKEMKSHEELTEVTIRRVRAVREAGAIERCHTVPHYSGYSNAAHSWGVAVLVELLHPDPPPRLVRAALFHDIAERWTGDWPAFVKWHDPELAARLDVIEDKIHKAIGLPLELTEEERRWLKACDMLELHLWCMDQLAMGNQNVTRPKANIEKWMREHQDEIPIPVGQLYYRYCWQRGTDTLPA